MKIAILGYGVEGKAAFKYWHGHGNSITIFDDLAIEPPKGAKFQMGPDWDLAGFDLVVRSPGVRPERIPKGLKTTSVTREFMDTCPAPIIGVTGTKGKGTTCALIAKILEAAGQTVHLGGNIGQPPVELLPDIKAKDWVVLELSSFQLMDVTKSPHIAVCLMIVPEHLNWHTDVSEYVEAKANIFRFQKYGDLAVYDAASSQSTGFAGLSAGTELPYLDPAGAHIEDNQIKFKDQVICATSAVGLLGPHNLENVCAAVAATYGIVNDPAPMAAAIKAFKGLEHRLELVGEHGGVRYYDDSFSTTPETAIAAINSFTEPKVLILGGSEKNSDYSKLAQLIAISDIRGIVVIGDIAQEMIGLLKEVGYTNVSTNLSYMDQMVEAATNYAKKGDVVLLSPAAASFGLFRDYKDRGNQFKQAVAALA